MPRLNRPVRTRFKGHAVSPAAFAASVAVASPAPAASRGGLPSSAARASLLAAAVLGLAVLSATPAQAAFASDWVGSLSGFWTNNSNWAGGFAPGAADTADFDNNNPSSVRRSSSTKTARSEP